ncbi:hypothetical protein [uncultured Streptococcus sp.]|uniref:hypothetical protein n=1 Tax=uncultured Streptococcus sp. TaxID=83427 RepID=UPI0028E2E6A2|nr:hypothetical protein [uncultured Streptococcus sp.]
MIKKFFLGMNYRRIILYTSAILTVVSWLFRINILQPYSQYELIFSLSTIMLFYFFEDKNKDEFLLIAIFYVLIRPLLRCLITLVNIDPNILLIISVILISVSWRIDSINKSDREKVTPKLNSDYFNLVYINSAKSYEIATLIDNTVKTTIQKENSNTTNNKNSFKVGTKNSLPSSYENSHELITGSKISESFEIKNTKSTIFRKVYEMAKTFQIRSSKPGDLVKFDNISLTPVNAQDIPLILQVLQSSKLDNPTTEGIELNMSNLLSTFLTDYTIDYGFKIGEENFLVRFPYGEIEGFENGYRHSDFQLGQLCLVGIDRGKINFSEVDTMSTKFLEFMSEQANKNNTAKIVKDIIQKSSIPESSSIDKSEFEFDFNYKKLDGEYHLIDVIAVVQKINVGKKDDLPI